MLTVIVPNFNHSRFLGQALGALAGQTRPPDEVIVIDDASTDDSITVIEAWLPKLPNARLLRNRTNLGVVRNMNIGLELARLRYCCRRGRCYLSNSSKRFLRCSSATRRRRLLHRAPISLMRRALGSRA